MSVACGCCVLSGRGLWDKPIPRPHELYRACVCVCVGGGVTECDVVQQPPSTPTTRSQERTDYDT